MSVTPLTENQIISIRRKIGDVGPLQTPPLNPAFPDPDIESVWQDNEGYLNGTILSLFEELAGNAWKFNDYTQNQSQEKKQQVFANLLKMVELWQKKVDTDTAVTQKGKGQVRIMGIRQIPEEIPDHPDFPLDGDMRTIGDQP